MEANNIQKIYIGISLFVIIVFIFTLFRIQTKTPSTLAVQESKDEFIKIIPDKVQIEKSDLKFCCEFINENKKMECWLIKKYNCDYCNTYCEAKDE